jgi:hypothetical protein
MATRRESVRLSLVDDFTPGMARAAAATALLNRELGNLSGQEMRASRTSTVFVRDLERMGRESSGTAKQIDRLSGRIGFAVDAMLTLGPAAVSMGAVAVPAVTALASSFGFAVVAAGSAAVAFGGVGDALGKLNDAHLDPTKDNLAEAEKAMKRLAPAAQDFVRQIDSMRGLGASLRDAGAESLFPGLVEALETLESRGPEAEGILRAINTTVGEIAAEGAASLASGRWGDFFHMIETEGPPVLDATADALGNVVHGLSEVFEAMAPLNRDALGWLVEATEGFDKWATGLKKTEGFNEFASYVRETGPEVAETVAAVATALLDIAEAAAPLGGPALNAIEGIARVVSAIASSDFATPLLAAVAAMRTINRLAPVTAGAMSALNGAGGATGGKHAAPKAPGRLAGAASGIAGGPWGLALTGGVAALAAYADAQAEARAEVDALRESLDKQTGALTGNTKAVVVAALEEEGILEKARSLGVSLDDVTEAALGNDKALGRVNEQIQNHIDAMPEVVAGDNRGAQAMQNALDAADGLRGAIGGKNKAIREAQDEQARLNEAMGKGTSAANDLTGAIKNIPKRWQTRLEVAAERAQASAQALKAELASIDRSIDIYVNIRRPNASGFGPQIGASADGGSVPKTGKPYADRHLYLLADGEEVISNRHGQADRHRPLLKAINANRRLASGGTTGGRRGVAFHAEDNTEALQRAIDRLTMVAEDQTAAVEDSTRKTELWADKMSDVAKSTVAGFNTGLFERGERGLGGGGPLANLKKDIAGLEQRAGLQQQLAGLGISGDALAALLSEGSNADLAGIIESGQAPAIAAAYEQRAALQQSVGGMGGQLAYGEQFAAADALREQMVADARMTERQLTRLNAEMVRVTAAIERMNREAPDRFAQGVNSAASAASRHGGGKRRPEAGNR